MGDKRKMKLHKEDVLSSLVVFLVALPLCLGIALASGAPLLSGVIAGIVGGIVVSIVSGSALGVSGPAAGLAVIVLLSIQELKSFELFLYAVVISGFLQILFGLLKAGVIQYYFPSAVIRGMLSGIGLVIMLKQLPHMFGYSPSEVGESSILGTFTASLSYGAVFISFSSLAIMLIWERLSKKHVFARVLPGSLLAVVSGMLFCLWGVSYGLFTMASEQYVNLGAIGSLDHLMNELRFPSFEHWNHADVYIIGLTIAVVGSLETLLCLDATDKLDPAKRVTPPNRELIAQGVGNIVSGCIGGLPITQVIVRSSANIHSGGKTKISAFCHGLLLFVSLVFFSNILNLIPLASLASILMLVGYKLANPQLFRNMYSKGLQQFLPFITTITGILMTDLLVGIGLGLSVSIGYILWNNFRNPYQLDVRSYSNDKTIKIVLAEHVSFLHKASLLEVLRLRRRGVAF